MPYPPPRPCFNKKEAVEYRLYDYDIYLKRDRLVKRFWLSRYFDSARDISRMFEAMAYRLEIHTPDGKVKHIRYEDSVQGLVAVCVEIGKRPERLIKIYGNWWTVIDDFIVYSPMSDNFMIWDNKYYMWQPAPIDARGFLHKR